MPPIEFDKPTTAPIDSSDDEKVQPYVVTQSGQRRTILRDKKGNLAYPSVVPPDVETPVLRQTKPTLAVPPDFPEGRPKHHSDPPPSPQTLAKSPTVDRPQLDKKFLTDVPRGSGQLSEDRRSIQRAGTNVSLFDTEVANQHQDDDDTSSTSSSGGEDDGRTHNHALKMGKKRKNKQQSDKRFRRFDVSNENYNTKGRISRKDGRLNITVNDTSNTGYLAKALGTAAKRVVTGKTDDGKPNGRPIPTRLSSVSATTSHMKRPKLNIVIMVIGSRGDIQPFLKIGKVLREEYGHKVRIATHPAFREFIEKDTGLEFFSVGGDPSELMAFMVKNPGMIPKLETVKAGDIGRRRASMAEMFQGFWRACISATDNEKDTRNLKMMGEKQPFIADAIIANPPSFAHIHCAEALGIPLHLMFTFPYTPTQAFPHPLATIKKSNVDPGYTNFISYPLVEMMVWQGLGDLVNDFRSKTLGLDPVSTLWAPGSTYRPHVPFTYMWSPGLIPKPEDWGEEIDISGFVFLDLASSFTPPEDLVEFLGAGEMPIYIGFGSIVVDDPDHFTEMIFEAVKLAGVRALVSKGWGGLGQDNVPENIYMLENTPHDWLFPRIRACIIHGGAGTTAIALKCGKPTMVVPFFGDQYFWGTMIGNARAGPMPIPYKKLTVETLAEGIEFCLTEEAQTAVDKIAKSIELEGDGAKNAVRAFHSHLALEGEDSMRCAILTDRVAVWKVRNTSLKLSALAAYIIVDEGLISWKNLRPLRHKEWNDFVGPGEPLTGVAGSLAGTVGDVFGGVGSVPYRMAKVSHRRTERKKKREERRKRHQQQKKKKSPTQAATSTSAAPSFPFPSMQSQEQSETTAIQSNDHAPAAPSINNNPPNNNAITPATTAATTPGTAGLTTAGTTNSNPQAEYFNEITTGVVQSGRAIAHAPVDLSLALAQGFHNAPRLYGDDTVRTPTRVTGFRSGMRAARREFGYGIYDGFTGLVRLPVRGARERGVRGAVAGVGMGITGFVLKDLAALFGPVGFALEGVAKQVSRRGGTDVERMERLIRRARIVQAQKDLAAVDGDGNGDGNGNGGEGEGGEGMGKGKAKGKGKGKRMGIGEDRKRKVVKQREKEKAVREEVMRGWRVLNELADLVAVVDHHGARRGLRGLFLHRHRHQQQQHEQHQRQETHSNDDSIRLNNTDGSVADVERSNNDDTTTGSGGGKRNDNNVTTGLDTATAAPAGHDDNGKDKDKSKSKTPLVRFGNDANERRLFESIEIAQRAIDAIKRGVDPETIGLQ